MHSNVVVESPQDILASMNDGNSRTKTRKDAGKFQRYIAASLNEDVLRLFREAEHLIRGNNMLNPRNNDAKVRGCPSCDENALGIYCRTACQLHQVRANKDGLLVDDLDARPLKIGHVGFLEPRNLF